MEDRKYIFDWSLLGDIELGRPNLGRNTRLEVYRLMQFTIRDVLEQRLGSQEADKIFYEAGKLAGKHFYEHFLTGAEDLNSYIVLMQDNLAGIGDRYPPYRKSRSGTWIARTNSLGRPGLLRITGVGI